MSSGGLNALATTLAILSAGRLPDWTVAERSSILTAIPSGSNGVALQDRVVAHVGVNLRSSLAGRTARLSVTTLDLAATYSVTVDGVACSHNAATLPDTTLAQVLQGIATAVNTTAASIAQATVDADTNEVVIRSLGVEGVAITAFAASGTGVIAVEAEPVSADVELWVEHIGLTGWFQLERHVVDRKGLALPHREVAGMSRLAVRLANVVGHPSDASGVTIRAARVAIGPCRVEPST